MESLLIKLLYVVALVAVTMFGFWIKHVSRSIGLLFAKYDACKTDIDRIRAILVADPSKTAIFNALMGGKDADIS